MTLVDRIDAIYDLARPSRYRAIEGLRAWAVWMVFNVHFFAYYYQQNYFLPAGSVPNRLVQMLHAGMIGVDLFFVISGFLIYRTLIKKNPTATEFFIQRVRRLLPAHVCVLLWLAFPSFKPWVFLENMVFVVVFIKGAPNYNFVTWSLGWEWLFYIVIFILFVLTGRSKARALALVLVGCALIMLGLQQLFAKTLDTNGVVLPDVGRFMAFFLGVVIARIETHLKAATIAQVRLLKGLSLLALCCIPAMQLLWTYRSDDTIAPNVLWRSAYFLAVSCSFAVLLLRVIAGGGILNRLLECRALRSVGQISYSFYLVHALIGIPLALTMVPRVIDFRSMGIHYVASLGFTFVIGSFVFYYLEKPYFRERERPRGWPPKALGVDQAFPVIAEQAS